MTPALKFKEMADKTREILDRIEDDDFEEMEKDPEFAIVDEDESDYEEMLETGARLYSTNRKFIFRGHTENGRVVLIAGDKETDIRNWLEGWAEEEDESSAA